MKVDPARPDPPNLQRLSCVFETFACARICRPATATTPSSTTSHACPSQRAARCALLPTLRTSLAYSGDYAAPVQHILSKTTGQTASPLHPSRHSVPSSRGSRPSEPPAGQLERLCAIKATPPLHPHPFGDLRTNWASATHTQHHFIADLSNSSPTHQRIVLAPMRPLAQTMQEPAIPKDVRPGPCHVTRFTFTIPALHSRVMQLSLLLD